MPKYEGLRKERVNASKQSSWHSADIDRAEPDQSLNKSA